MKNKIGKCGLDCSQCEAYIATKNNDDKARVEIARQWSERYGGKCTPEDCICDGCNGDGIISTAHANNCSVRICANEHDVLNCGYCPEYPCEKISEFLKFLPDFAKENLDNIHKNISG